MVLHSIHTVNRHTVRLRHTEVGVNDVVEEGFKRAG